MQIVKINKLKGNPSNPRVLRDDKFAKLKKSIEEFPDMLNKRPIVAVTDKDGKLMVLGGNMRLRACQELGLKEVPVILADEWTEEQRREFIIKDNVGFGEWDWRALANEWDTNKLQEWGMEMPFDQDAFEEMKNPENAETEHQFATELDRANNYIVLQFENDIDWIQAKTLLGLKTEKARRKNGKPWSSGIGRVINGAAAINKLTNAN